jgi:methylmalonyl-CoA/ethylmalonyl-CoA epimerase
MMLNVEHIGIAVRDLAEAENTYSKLFGIAPYKRETVASEMVSTSFFKVNQTKIELLQATSEASAISKFVAKKGEGIHHIAYEVSDIFQEIKRLKEEGFVFINEVPKKGADNKMVCFLHPKSTQGVLIELCQEMV